jgi:hypothetical protein
MIARELKRLGRGFENYSAAKAKAEAEGLPFDQPSQLRGETVHADRVIGDEALTMNDGSISHLSIMRSCTDLS